jgi:hypothetical protein
LLGTLKGLALKFLRRLADPDATMVISKDKMKNVILSIDRGFRSHVSRLFTDISFSGEKFFATTCEEAIAAIKFDRLALNICISPDNLETEDYLAKLAMVNQAVAGTQIVALAYFRVDQSREMAEIRESLSNIHLRLLPVKRSEFVAIYRTQRLSGVEGFKPPIITKDNLNKEKSNNRKKALTSAALNFFEATQHLRECVEDTNKILSNPYDIAILIKIGQKFNGLVGTYCFLKEKDGYKELFQLGVVVDDLSRTYGKIVGENVMIAPHHVELLVDCIKSSFSLLKSLRAGQELNPSLISSATQLYEKYLAAEDIDKRKLESQDAVEALVEQWRAG